MTVLPTKRNSYKYNRKWRLSHPEGRKAQKKRYYDKYNFGDGSFRRWSEEEDRLVRVHAIPDRKLAEKLKRSVQAIQSRRTILKKRASENG